MPNIMIDKGALVIRNMKSVLIEIGELSHENIK